MRDLGILNTLLWLKIFLAGHSHCDPWNNWLLMIKSNSSECVCQIWGNSVKAALSCCTLQTLHLGAVTAAETFYGVQYVPHKHAQRITCTVHTGFAQAIVSYLHTSHNNVQTFTTWSQTQRGQLVANTHFTRTVPLSWAIGDRLIGGRAPSGPFPAVCGAIVEPA